jgi:pyrroloquinoline quinone (PQQ) biosynthesis protein C/quercetin dioxygenase-like cupin family protein
MHARLADGLLSRLVNHAMPESGTFDKPTSKDMLGELHRRRDEHPMWESRFLRLLAHGAFTRDDLKYVFGQYYHYSRNFTRYIAALMARCPDDLFRSRLSENLWDEGGGAEPGRRHAQIYRDFLRNAFGLTDPDEIPCESYTAAFVREYLDFCMNAEPLATAAFLSLGTESIVPRLYTVFIEGLRRAGIANDMLEFFHIHVSVDDEHAVTLEQMMCAEVSEPRWLETCARAADNALALRTRFFHDLLRGVQFRRVQDCVDRVQDHVSLVPPNATEIDLLLRSEDPRGIIYENVDERRCVDFEVQSVPFRCETLEPRVVRIAPHRRNERHRHAHETFYYVLQGCGRIAVDNTILIVKEGDMAFVPRWSLHQTANDGDDPMIVLAVTDFAFSSRAHLGEHNPRWKQPMAVSAP